MAGYRILGWNYFCIKFWRHWSIKFYCWETCFPIRNLENSLWHFNPETCVFGYFFNIIYIFFSFLFSLPGILIRQVFVFLDWTTTTISLFLIFQLLMLYYIFPKISLVLIIIILRIFSFNHFDFQKFLHVCKPFLYCEKNSKCWP